MGKTKVAFDMAKERGGEVVNLDKIYTYRHFRIGTGLSDSLNEPMVRRHLYEIIEPDEPIISPTRYISMVRENCQEISKGGKISIIEGGSTTYFPELYAENERDPFIQQTIGLCYPRGFDISKKIEKRVQTALDEGLLDEVKMGVEKYPNSLIMNDCHFIVPFVKYLNHEIGFDNAKEMVTQRCLSYIALQMECFEAYPKIEWIEIDVSS